MKKVSFGKCTKCGCKVYEGEKFIVRKGGYCQNDSVSHVECHSKKMDSLAAEIRSLVGGKNV